MVHLVENLYVFCEGKVKVEDLPKRMRENEDSKVFLLETVERKHVKKVVDYCWR